MNFWANQPTCSFLVGCLNSCLQGTSVRVGLPQPSNVGVNGRSIHHTLSSLSSFFLLCPHDKTQPLKISPQCQKGWKRKGKGWCMLWTASLNYWGWELESDLELGWRLSGTKLDQHKGDTRPTPSRPRLDAYLFELGCTTITKVKRVYQNMIHVSFVDHPSQVGSSRTIWDI